MVGPKPNKACYRFLKTTASGTSFAKVEVELLDTSQELTVQTDLNCPADVGNGEIRANDEPGWVEAAERGVRHVLMESAPEKDMLTGRLVIRRIIGTIVDTTPDAVECAAALATFKVLWPTSVLPAISSDRPWRIVSATDTNFDVGY